MGTSIIYSTEKIHHEIIPENGPFPNNPRLPVLIYKGILELPDKDGEKAVKQIFEGNKWGNVWTDSIFDYHHFHSIAHEVLGICAGSCNVMLGGPGSRRFSLEKGDVIIIPAGVAHKNLGSSDDFKCVGAYPGGADYDIKKGSPEEKAQAQENIKKVSLPEKDPVYGKGPLQNYWH
jgi:uncharacterized protein YjlB